MPAESVMSVVCGCGKRLKAPTTAAGKKAKCPSCGTVMVLSPPAQAAAVAKSRSPVAVPITATKSARPAPASVARPAPPPQPTPAEEEDPFGAMYELAQQAKPAASAPDGVYCPQCRSTMDANAVLCTNCGYDTRTGKSLTVTAEAVPLNYRTPPGPNKKPAKPIDYMAPDGSLMMGIILSGVFAFIASLVWIVVAWATGFAIGYIALLIGGAAGVGMQIGHKGYSKAGGVIAALMTLFAIVVAKITVLEIILSAKGEHISDLDGSRLGLYFFNPMGLIIIVIGVGAGYRTANGSSK